MNEKSMSVHHEDVSTNNHLIAAMTQAEAVIQYLTIKGVSVKGVILHDCKPVIPIEHHTLCEQLLKRLRRIISPLAKTHGVVLSKGHS
ncbi:MAG: hypothetical protein ACR5LG_10160 [Sodalis sp. (in: enterobacteria)]|uniref:hypothetical protein n=1 Tax=Sodalis sp. (in: enterobacteria) TaxID=1898979 RepID=UPI003F35929C